MLNNELIKQRLGQLTDAIFAMSLIIMMSNIDVPKFGGEDDIKVLSQVVTENLADIGIYLLTFIIIAIHWVKNLEIFSAVKCVSKIFIWQQLIFLCFIMLLPVTNLFVTVDDKNQLVLIVYSANLMVLGLMTWLSWRTVFIQRQNSPSEDDEIALNKEIETRFKEAKTEPIVAALSIPAAIVSVVYWEAVFLLVPIAFMLREKFTKKAE